ncbi:type III restriction/modification enzyme restriction subunit [Rhizobium subbaraonis]|uniref:Type III restriction/modification enzyme restriction subunit n=1 Tax=Rhizobium subbaraonis TaxID=908946 RepID=A0A285UJ32_9HYPH|nr:helicase-related protein [Rhizobium subbaraonis]SOC41890.1 type III restriction/modification enzyme restriction subunit [Rhizobium subbaraonis]
MKLLQNTGKERVIDQLHRWLGAGTTLDVMSPDFSLHAFAEAREPLARIKSCRLLLGEGAIAGETLFGGAEDIGYRGKLQGRWLARTAHDWLKNNADIRRAAPPPPQSMIIVNDGQERRAVVGASSFTTEGMGITPGSQLGLIQATDSDDEASAFARWFQSHWEALKPQSGAEDLLSLLAETASQRPASLLYFKFLFELFKDMGDELDEERIVKSATGIRNTTVWKKLFKFQRDGVVGAIDKLERLGGCIIADSVGLGKTFEALAVIKYYELRNDRVLVLCPKRLRDNWTLYKANDHRNSLAGDRFNYDVLNHTDLSREGGLSGDIDLSHVNWGNYDLVVIDESHNFRNKATHRDRDTRYDHLMKRIIKAGVKTKVLMLSATPVNNRLADLKNQIAFMTEGNDLAFIDHGIPSIEATIRKAQGQFNRWLDLPEDERRPTRLMDMLGFDYFKLLDMLTIARSRKHVQRYYGTAETGQFPDRLRPVNIKADVDIAGEFRPIREINNEIRRLTLGAYAPLRYVLAHKQAAYDAKYSTKIRGGESYFRQADREESLIHLMRVNLLKRMESSVASFALTIKRQLDDVTALLAKLDSHDESIDELSIDDVDIDDPNFEALLVGRKVKVLLQDVDRVRWRQDLTEDRNRLATLYSAARAVTAARDAKLAALKELIAHKVHAPINEGNRKILLFTAFADTADYLYREVASWARSTLGINAAVVTGTGANKTTLTGLRADMSSVLSAFSPRSKERPEDLSAEGEIELLIATDCISEGQNLQDCDFLINYDIHWNPVRIIQRFGRVDRIGSTNTRIQLVNFWPNMELDEYLDLESRVSGRMVLLDVSATGEENVIEFQAGNQMNDLEYRRAQLQKLQDAVIDLEDLSSGVSIADLTLNDFRVDLAGFLRENRDRLEALSLGTYAVVATPEDGSGNLETAIPPGAIFCLRAVGDAAAKAAEPGYPLSPHFVVHVSDEGEVLLPYTQAKQVLDRLKKLCIGRDLPDAEACGRFDKVTRHGRDMELYQKLLSRAVAAIAGKSEERAVASLFSAGGTHALKGEFAGINDFEVVAFVVVLPKAGAA